MTRVLMTLGMLAVVAGCEANKALWYAGASTLSGAMGTLGSYLISTLAALAPTTI